MPRLFDFSDERPPAPLVWVVLLDESGRRAVCSQNLHIPEPRVGDRINRRIVIELEHWANGVGARSKPV